MNEQTKTAHNCSGACSCNAHRSCISLVPIFNHLEPDQMDEIMSVTHPATYTKGELLYRPGDTSDTLYILHSGLIRIYRLAESGKEQLVRFLNPGDFTGELALFSESKHEAYAEAVKETQVPDEKERSTALFVEIPCHFFEIAAGILQPSGKVGTADDLRVDRKSRSPLGPLPCRTGQKRRRHHHFADVEEGSRFLPRDDTGNDQQEDGLIGGSSPHQTTEPPRNRHPRSRWLIVSLKSLTTVS